MHADVRRPLIGVDRRASAVPYPRRYEVCSLVPLGGSCLSGCFTKEQLVVAASREIATTCAKGKQPDKHEVATKFTKWSNFCVMAGAGSEFSLQAAPSGAG